MARGDSLLSPAKLAAQVRQRLVSQATAALHSLLEKVQERLSALMDEMVPSPEAQLRRDAWMAYQQLKERWLEGTVKAWQSALEASVRPSAPASESPAELELLGMDVLEHQIIASRLALSLMEKTAQAVNDLRQRLKFLNDDQALDDDDIVHPEVLILPLVEQWEACGLSRQSWQLVSSLIQQHINEQLQKVYVQCNQELIAQGVLPVIEFAAKPPSAVSAQLASASPVQEQMSAPETPAPQAQSQGVAPPPNGAGMLLGPSVPAGQEGRAQHMLEQLGRLLGGAFLSSAASSAGSSGAASAALAGGASMPMPLAAPAAMAPASACGSYPGPTASLMLALAQQPRLNDYHLGGAQGGGPQLATPVLIGQVASELRQQSTDLKGKAGTDNEKAIIELVALMFQAILQEDRIPPVVRVWFARLQMPVLRIALADSEFFQKLDHPARQLIDHMGSCVLGFDASGISSEELETEIKRVVQVIEQYPDTGERVYRRVYEEFKAFLKRHLAKKSVAQKVLGVAEQLEQKETLTIQYTIELRDQLKDMPVREEIRAFLFKVWAEVLAVSTLRQGKQQEQTLLLKKAAADLIWAASAKPSRSDRTKVIADLPELLQSLRTGMTLLGTVRSAQDAHINIISAVLADAFMSKTEVIADEQIQALAKRLAELDDYVGEGSGEELSLSAEDIEELLGVDAGELDVITEGGGQASAAMMSWLRQLALGSWFTLSYQSALLPVQHVWRSPLGHLYLFASNAGHSYLFQSSRLGAYLQSGLLVPQEDESLMTRATRIALAAIQAHPERLLN